jgi:hypothetical protein
MRPDSTIDEPRRARNRAIVGRSPIGLSDDTVFPLIRPQAAMTSGGACTNSMSTPSPPIGDASLPFGWMKRDVVTGRPLANPARREADALRRQPLDRRAQGRPPTGPRD